MAVNGEEIVPGIGKKQAAVLNNESARRLEHERHLEELGFPKYVEPGYMRHAPVSYDDPDNPTPSRIVNQAGQDLGDQNKDESDHFAKNTYKPAKPLAKEAFLEFMSKEEDPLPNRSQAELQRTEELGLSPDATATEIAQAQGQKDLMYRPDPFDPSVQESSYLSGYDTTTGEAIYDGFTTDAEGNRVDKETSAFKGPAGSTFAPPGSIPLLDAEGNPREGTGPGGSITFGDIAPKTEDDAGDGLSDISNSIQKSMEIFSNLVMKDNGPLDRVDSALHSVFTNLYDKAKGLFSGGTDSVDDSSEVKQLEQDTQNASKDAQDKAKKEGYDFPTYADYIEFMSREDKAQGKDNIEEYLRLINDGKLLIVPASTGDRYTPEEFKEKEPVKEITTVTYDPDTGVYLEDGVMKPIIDGDMSAGGYPASTFGSQYGGPRITDKKIEIGEGQELDQFEEEKIKETAMGTTAFQPVNVKTGDPINTAAINAAAKTNEPIKYTLKPVMDAGPNRSAMESVGLEGSGKSNVFTYVPPPPKGDTQAALNISPDQRMDPAQRTALATAAYKRELAILSGDSKRMAAYGLGPDFKGDVNKSMEKYQAWIQKAEDEGAMAKVQLDRVSDLADMMHDALDEEDQLPGWIQNKISDSLHNLEASFTHIAYDKKQDMELSKSKEMFSNILQKDNHTSSYRGFVTQPGVFDVQPTAAQQTGALATTASGFKDIDPKRFKGKLGPVTGILEIGERLWGGNDWLKAPETANKLKRYSSKALNYVPKFAGAGAKGPVLGIAAVAASGAVGKRAIDAVSPKASEETRKTIQDMASAFISNPVSFLAGDASAMPRKKDGGLYETSDITSALKDFGANLFKEDISLQKDEGGFDAFGRPTTPAITPKPRRGTGVRRATAAEAGVTSEPPRRGPLSSLDDPTIDLSPQEKEILRGTKRDLFGLPKRSLGEVTLEPSGDLSAAEQRAKIERISQQIPESSRFQGRDPRGRATLARGASKGLRDAIYDELLDNPPKEVGRGMGTPPPAFGRKYKTPLELDRGAGRFTAMPPTKQELLQVQDYVDDFKSGAIKAGKGILRGKKGLISLLGAAGLGSAFNYLQQQGADLFDDGGSTRVQ